MGLDLTACVLGSLLALGRPHGVETVAQQRSRGYCERPNGEPNPRGPLHGEATRPVPTRGQHATVAWGRRGGRRPRLAVAIQDRPTLEHLAPIHVVVTRPRFVRAPADIVIRGGRPTRARTALARSSLRDLRRDGAGGV